MSIDSYTVDFSEDAKKEKAIKSEAHIGVYNSKHSLLTQVKGYYTVTLNITSDFKSKQSKGLSLAIPYAAVNTVDLEIVSFV